MNDERFRPAAMRAMLAELGIAHGEGAQRTIVRCSCGGGHFLQVDSSPADDEIEIYLTAESYNDHPTWRWRLALAWRVLIQQAPHAPWFESVLSPADALLFAEGIQERVAESIRRAQTRERD